MAQHTALIIGASGGIGHAIVMRLLHDGFFVCATYAHESERAAVLRQGLRGGRGVAYHMDLLDRDGTERVMAQIVQEHPTIGAVVFAPSTTLPSTQLLETAWQTFQEHLDVQLRGMWQVVSGLQVRIKAKHPIAFTVVLSTVCMGEPVPRFTPYVAAKYALMGFAKCMAIELARFGCRTNMVLPGLTATPLTAGVPPKLFELEAAQNPLGRITTPEDVAAVVAFLVSEDAAYLNGAQISVNGGARIG